jgi:hypothetical protein
LCSSAVWWVLLYIEAGSDTRDLQAGRIASRFQHVKLKRWM